MEAGQPSRTALAAAAARAAHLILDGEPKIFEDPPAVVLRADLADDLLAVHRDIASAELSASMRVAITTRSRSLLSISGSTP